MTRKLIAFGALAGLAWAASVRGYMAQLAGPDSSVTWLGTFVLILLPGVVVGAALGWAEAIRRSGGRRGWRWLAAVPLLLPIFAMLSPGELKTLLTTGAGAGSIVLVLTGLAGGYAISGRGPLWARIVCGMVAAAVFVAGVPGQSLIRPDLAVTDPRGAWVAVLGFTLTMLLILACSIPHRKVVPR